MVFRALFEDFDWDYLFEDDPDDDDIVDLLHRVRPNAYVIAFLASTIFFPSFYQPILDWMIDEYFFKDCDDKCRQERIELLVQGPSKNIWNSTKELIANPLDLVKLSFTFTIYVYVRKKISNILFPKKKKKRFTKNSTMNSAGESTAIVTKNKKKREECVSNANSTSLSVTTNERDIFQVDHNCGREVTRLEIVQRSSKKRRKRLKKYK